MEDNLSIYERIDRIRRKRGIKQKDLLSAADLSPSYMGILKRRPETTPKYSTIAKIAEILNTTPQELMGEESEAVEPQAGDAPKIIPEILDFAIHATDQDLVRMKKVLPREDRVNLICLYYDKRLRKLNNLPERSEGENRFLFNYSGKSSQ